MAGPFTPEELAASKTFGPKALICPSGGTLHWRRADTVPELLDVLGGNMDRIARLQRAVAEFSRAVERDASKADSHGDHPDLKRQRRDAAARELLSRIHALEIGLPDSATAHRSRLRVKAEQIGHLLDQARQTRQGVQERERSHFEERYAGRTAAPASPSAQLLLAPPLPAEPVAKRVEHGVLERVSALTGKWIFIAASLFFSLRYLIWRALHTLNYASDAHLTVSMLLLCAEIYGFASVLLFFLQVLAPSHVDAVPIEGELPTVDVFVTIFNEPLEILEHTLTACKAMDYPAAKFAVHVLDDGPRAEVSALARRYGFNYLTRDDKLHAKAGNLNAALPRTRSEFILILDTDHIPVRSFLKETLGFFKEPEVAFVQTPHHFYNPDCYQKNLILESELVHEQDLFFQVIQPGRNDANAVVFAGSAAVFRRKALEEIGGFRADCAIEDLHTGMELQSRGWRGVYYRRILSSGLSPESFAGYLTQRKRWTRGGVQLFFLDNPLFKKGLSFRQRLYYFGSLIYFFHGWSRLIYLLAPLSFLLARYDPIVTGTWTLLWYFIPHFLASHAVFSLLTREYRSPFWSDVYESASAFTLSWTAFATMFVPETLVFKVTPKGLSAEKESFHWRGVIPHILLSGLLLLGIIKATYRFMHGDFAVDAYGLSCIWAFFNFVLMASSIEVARERPHHRHAIRLPRSYPVVLYADGQEFVGRTVNISLTGAQIDLPDRVELPKHALARIIGDGDTVLVECEVRHCRWLKRRGARVGLHFHKISPVQNQQLVLLLFSAPNSWQEVRRPLRDSARAFKDIAASVMRKRLRRQRDVAVASAVDLHHAEGSLRIRLEELHRDSVVAVWPQGFEPLGPLSLGLDGAAAGTFIPVEIGEFMGGSGGLWTFALRFSSSEKIKREQLTDGQAAGTA